MFNTYIFLKQIKGKWLFTLCMNLLIFVLTLVIIITVGDPSDNPGPQKISSLNSIITNIMQNDFLLLLLVLTAVLTSTFLIKEIYTGSMTYIVSSPVSRREIISTKIIFMFFSLFVGYLINLIVFTPLIAMLADKSGFLPSVYVFKLTGAYLFSFLISAITFIAAAASKNPAMAYVIGIGLPILFELIYILSMVSDSLESLKYMTIYTLYTSPTLKDNGAWNAAIPSALDWVPEYILMGLGGIGLYIGSAFIFCHRDLQL